jgi:hypothetical protein
MTTDRPPRSRPDFRDRVAARFLRLVNPLARRMIPAGVPTGAPSILLIVRGRRSGIERMTPVGMLESVTKCATPQRWRLSFPGQGATRASPGPFSRRW